MTEVDYGKMVEGIISRIESKLENIHFEQSEFDAGLCSKNEYEWNSKAEWVYGIGTLTDERAVIICSRGRGKETVPGIWPERVDMNDPDDLEVRIENEIQKTIDRLRCSSSLRTRLMTKDYVGQQDGVYKIGGTRVSLDSVVYAYRRGASPESIQRSFPSITLEQVHGALAFYLSHQVEIDKYLVEGEEEFEKLRQASSEAHPDWHEKLQRTREEALTSQS
jgi:uncharacterized protein (DUF433 family)